MSKLVRWFAVLACVAGAGAMPVRAQQPVPRPGDVASPEAIVEAAYDALARAPGAPFQWDRMRSLFFPGARLIPNTEQTGGRLQPQLVEEFIQTAQQYWDTNIGIGSEKDKGFEERQIAARVERYGDIAHVFSTYEKYFWKERQPLGRGINSFQLLWHDGRWWITSLIWDEEVGAGPIPEKYRGST